MWRGKGGLKAIIYLVDGIVSVKGEHQVREATAQVRGDLENAGFIINAEGAFPVIDWLGFRIDFAEGMFFCSPQKVI